MKFLTMGKSHIDTGLNVNFLKWRVYEKNYYSYNDSTYSYLEIPNDKLRIVGFRI